MKTKDGATIETLADIVAYMETIGDRIGKSSWIHLASLLKDFADGHGDVAAIAHQLELALLTDYQLVLWRKG
jgi:hypothetical protein